MAETQQKAHEADNGQVPLEFDEEAAEVEISPEVSPVKTNILLFILNCANKHLFFIC